MNNLLNILNIFNNLLNLFINSFIRESIFLNYFPLMYKSKQF